MIRSFFDISSCCAVITKGKKCLMSQPSETSSKSSRLRSRIFIIGGILLLNVVLVGAMMSLMSAPRAAVAQDDKPDATPVPGGVRFDNYPHPQSRGALAYTLGD